MEAPWKERAAVEAALKSVWSGLVPRKEVGKKMRHATKTETQASKQVLEAAAEERAQMTAAIGTKRENQ
jgi:hypothetical protein